GISAFRMRDHRSVRISFANLADAARRELDVDVTGPLPQIHFPAGTLHYPCPEVLVGYNKNMSILRRGPHDLISIATRANHISQRFHASTAIDVGDNVIIFIGAILQ